MRKVDKAAVPINCKSVMSQEQNFDLMNWWNEQSFPCKELFKLDESGDVILLSNSNIKERVITKISAENCDAVLKNLIEKFAIVDSRIREMELEWLGTDDKLKLADKVMQTKEFLQHALVIGDFLKPALLVHDWEHTIYALAEENYAAKLKITELAESLTQSNEWKETAQAFRDIGDKWKQTGHIDKNRNDKLWNRIETARKAFNERKRLHHEDEEKDLLTNLDLKMDLVEQAEAIAKSEEWKKTAEAFTRLTEEWKRIGHTLHKKNEELWQRFMTAKSAFFDRKREHSNKIQQEHEVNYVVKLALVERAEAMKESRDWNTTSQAYAALMDEWKKAGRVQHEKSEELWKRFTEAQDYFFETKKAHFDEIKGSLENNYNLKKELYERAEQLKNSNSWSETTNAMVDLLEEWKKIGPIPRSYGDKMWEDFNAARKYFFARKDAFREQRKQFAESQKTVRAEQAKGLVGKLALEIKEEEEKLADFTTGLENITPGKKAAALRSHLENLIAEGAEKIKRLQQKLEQAKNDLQLPERESTPKENVAKEG